MSHRVLIALFLAIGLAAASCRREAFELNRQRLIGRTEVQGAGPGFSEEDLRKTKEAFVDLTIGLNTFRHEKKFASLSETVQYLKDVIFSGEIPGERFSGQNKIVGSFDGTGGWVLYFVNGGDGFRLGLNVKNEKREPVGIILKE